MSIKRIIIYYAGFERFGGVFSHVRALNIELSRLGYEVEVITLDRLPIYCRYIPHIFEKIINYFKMPIGFYHKGLITKKLYKFFFNFNADIRIYEDIYISWNSNVPSITIMHAVWSDNLQAYDVKSNQLKKLKNIEIDIINKIKHPISTVSQPYLEYINNIHFYGKLNKKINVVELGVDESKFFNKKNVNLKSIVYSGSLEKRKNVIFLLKIFKLISAEDSKYKLTIIGDGPTKYQLFDFVKVHKLNVIFLGSLKHEEVLLELHKHGVYLHTSVKESFSYSLLEAKLAGLRTYAYSKLQVPPEFIDIGIDSFNIEDWATAILNDDLNSNKFIAEKYSVQRMTLNTLESVR